MTGIKKNKYKQNKLYYAQNQKNKRLKNVTEREEIRQLVKSESFTVKMQGFHGIFIL